jgi:xylulose-5-phosphate/fructose-6-phosphate phosphoketolase
LESYAPKELFTEDGTPKQAVLDNIPKDPDYRMGQRRETYAGYTPLNVADWKSFCVERGAEASCMLIIGSFIDKVFVDNPTTIRMFSPDELESNKLSAVFKHTNRNFQWDPETHARGGRVIEILSEHTCQGLLQGRFVLENWLR